MREVLANLIDLCAECVEAGWVFPPVILQRYDSKYVYVFLSDPIERLDFVILIATSSW